MDSIIGLFKKENCIVYFMSVQLNFNFSHKLGHLNHMFCSVSPCTRAISGCGADGTGGSCARDQASSDAPAVLFLLFPMLQQL